MRPQLQNLLSGVTANTTGKAFDTYGHHIYTFLIDASNTGLDSAGEAAASGPGELGTTVTIDKPSTRATIVVQGSVDGTNWTQIGSTYNITGDGVTEFSSTSIYYPYLRSVLTNYFGGTYTVKAAMSGHGGEGP